MSASVKREQGQAAALRLRPTPQALLEELLAAHKKTHDQPLPLHLATDDGAEAGQQELLALFPPGTVVELQALPGAGALSLGLLLLQQARQRALALGQPSWLFLSDSTRSLCAPAVAALGVDLEELLVCTPPAQAVARVAVRAARSGAFCGLLVDATAVLDTSSLEVGVRRLVLAVEEARAVGVVVTSSRARRGLPLPCTARALVEVAPSSSPSSAAASEVLVARLLRHPRGLHAPSSSWSSSSSSSSRRRNAIEVPRPRAPLDDERAVDVQLA